jgi:hypothetical protein
MTEKKVLYIAIGFLQAFLGQTWVQSLYNDPSFVNTRGLSEWAVIASLTTANSILAALIVWKSYTSSPGTNGKGNGNGAPSLPPPVTQKPADTTP